MCSYKTSTLVEKKHIFAHSCMHKVSRHFWKKGTVYVVSSDPPIAMWNVRCSFKLLKINIFIQILKMFKGLKETVVNWECQWSNERSIYITSTVPLNAGFLFTVPLNVYSPLKWFLFTVPLNVYSFFKFLQSL